MKLKKLNLNFEKLTKPIDIVTRQELLSQVLGGKWASRYKGKGLEFSEYRPYVYGDDASMIDWKASLRANSTLVKIFQIDKSAKVFFIFDVSDSMLFSSRKDGKMKVEYAAELIMFMVQAVLQSGDAVGLAMFNDKIISRVAPNIGVEVQERIKNELCKLSNYGGHFDFMQAMNYILSISGDKVVIVLVSDFIGLKGNWDRYIQILSQKYDIIGIMVKDHRDRYLPNSGQILLKDPSNNESIYVDSSKYAKKYHEAVLEEEHIIDKKFKKAKSQILKLETTEDGFSELVRFFKDRVALISSQKL